MSCCLEGTVYGTPFCEWLETTGVENINNVNRALEAASPWFLKFGAKSMAELG